MNQLKCGMYSNFHKWKCTIKFTLNDASDIDDAVKVTPLECLQTEVLEGYSLNWLPIMWVKKIEFSAKDASDIENCGLINRFIFRKPLEIVFVFQLQ